MTNVAERASRLIIHEVGRTRRVQAAPFAGRLILIDGRAGSGKTTIAKTLQQHTGWQLVGLDECYPGWEGLSAGAAKIASEMLTEKHFTTFDWNTGTPSPIRELASETELIVEGCGSLNPEAIATARDLGIRVVRVWVECDTVTRKSRALGRDGDMFRPFWDVWAQQELEQIHRNSPLALAQIVIHTSVHS